MRFQAGNALLTFLDVAGQAQLSELGHDQVRGTCAIFDWGGIIAQHTIISWRQGTKRNVFLSLVRTR